MFSQPITLIHRRALSLAALVLIVLLAACAPDDLDITPTVAPTAIPPTAEPGAAQPTVTGLSPERELVDKFLANTPDKITAGAIQWVLDPAVPLSYAPPRGGTTARITYKESGGGQFELTWGVFPSAEVAKTHFDAIVKSVNDQGQTRLSENADYPTPNAFGSGSYGSNGIFVMDNVFIRISVPRISSTAGNPILPLVPTIMDIYQKTLAAS